MKKYTIDQNNLAIIYCVLEAYKMQDEYSDTSKKLTANNINRVASANWLSERLKEFKPSNPNSIGFIEITENEKYGLISIINYLDRNDTSELLKYLRELKPNKKI